MKIAPRKLTAAALRSVKGGANAGANKSLVKINYTANKAVAANKAQYANKAVVANKAQYANKAVVANKAQYLNKAVADYKPQRTVNWAAGRSGFDGGAVKFGYDIKANKKV